MEEEIELKRKLYTLFYYHYKIKDIQKLLDIDIETVEKFYKSWIEERKKLEKI